MPRLMAFATCLALLVSALLLAETPRKKDTIEPPPPAKPKVEPPPVKPTPPPAKPKIEPPPPVKPRVEPPPPKPTPPPEKPKPKAVAVKSPFTEPATSLEKTTMAKKSAEKKIPDKTTKKPVIDKPRTAKKPAAQGGYVHTVIIPLKYDAPTDVADRMVADCHAMLARIPSVRSIKAGRPAEKHSPDFVKKDYSVGLLVLVDDHDGLMAYLNHPLHVQFVDRYKKYIDFDRARVFDFMDEK